MHKLQLTHRWHDIFCQDFLILDLIYLVFYLLQSSSHRGSKNSQRASLSHLVFLIVPYPDIPLIHSSEKFQFRFSASLKILLSHLWPIYKGGGMFELMFLVSSFGSVVLFRRKALHCSMVPLSLNDRIMLMDV